MRCPYVHTKVIYIPLPMVVLCTRTLCYDGKAGKCKVTNSDIISLVDVSAKLVRLTTVLVDEHDGFTESDKKYLIDKLHNKVQTNE